MTPALTYDFRVGNVGVTLAITNHVTAEEFELPVRGPVTIYDGTRRACAIISWEGRS